MFSNYEIEKYKESGIFTIAVAEVENLFLVEEIIKLLATHMGQDEQAAKTTFEKVKKYVIQDRFATQIEKQICQSVVANLKYQLGSAELSKKNDAEAKESLEKIIASLDFERTKAEQTVKFKSALDSESYFSVLQVFNEKNLAKTIGNYFGLRNDAYCDTILALMKGQMYDDIVTALSPYLPPEIPR